jgi:hypothetical protein
MLNPMKADAGGNSGDDGECDRRGLDRLNAAAPRCAGEGGVL